MSIKAIIDSLQDVIVPVGTTVAAIRFTLTPPDGSQPVVQDVPGAPAAGVTSADFAATVVGDYTISAQAIDANGNPIANPVSATANVAAPTTITVQVPGAISASVA